ncbi:MAG: RNA polymerase subunit sigma [Epsilonproteobacteria bacterium]|jgi:NAD-dependent deacetylase|nr:RNA polymerase subunit sigma [Campylobacterota bacterium]NPA89324.1 NAD-dependent deacylase [Campylobacterota bacterium]
MVPVTTPETIQKVREIIQMGGGVAFTGAGISVESGIPPFRGPNGLWSRYDPKILDIDYFRANPKRAWEGILELFYLKFQNVKPNFAHFCLADLERKGKILGVITQNIDNLHQLAGSQRVVEFHGTASRLQCLQCGRKYPTSQIGLEKLPPQCPQCGGVLKPDFVFFGEPIPPDAFSQSLQWVSQANFMLVIGTSGEIQPASQLPFLAKERGATIIEINIESSAYTHTITDFFIQSPATKGCQLIEEMV